MLENDASAATNPVLVLPVDPGAGAARQRQVAGDAGNAGIGEPRHHRPQRPRRQRLAHVGEQQHLAGGAGAHAVERGRLAAARLVAHHGHAAARAGGVARGDAVGLVGRAVGEDDDVELVGGIVERQQRVELGWQIAGGVVRGDTGGHRRQPGLVAARAQRREARQDGDENGIAYIGVEQERERAERDRRGQHVSGAAGRSAPARPSPAPPPARH